MRCADRLRRGGGVPAGAGRKRRAGVSRQAAVRSTARRRGRVPGDEARAIVADAVGPARAGEEAGARRSRRRAAGGGGQDAVRRLPDAAAPARRVRAAHRNGRSSQQTVAVVDAFDDPTAEADLAVYDKQFGLPACTSANGCFRKIDEEGKASRSRTRKADGGREISIDVQMAHAICQSCHVLLVEAEQRKLQRPWHGGQRRRRRRERPRSATPTEAPSAKATRPSCNDATSITRGSW